MNRPCVCDRDECRLCWLCQHDARYRALWDGNATPDAIAPGSSPPAPVQAGPCRHMGQATGESVRCPSCRGHVELKLFACALHGNCTPTRAAPGACCVTCPDRAPMSEPPLSAPPVAQQRLRPEQLTEDTPIPDTARLFAGSAGQFPAGWAGWGNVRLAHMEAVRDVGCWDESFVWDVSDIDYYNRLRWRGWEERSLLEACAIHHVSQTQPALAPDQREAVDRDHRWSIEHYAHKWGCAWEQGDRGRMWATPYNL